MGDRGRARKIKMKMINRILDMEYWIWGLFDEV